MDSKLDLSEWIDVDHGSAKGQWTGRIQDDGIMDQFLDFNVSNLFFSVLDYPSIFLRLSYLLPRVHLRGLSLIFTLI